MSIYGSMAAPSDDEHLDVCGIWIKDGNVWEMRDKSACTCGQPDTPLVYQGSHVLPSEDDERGGWIDIALIPSHITRDGRDDRPEDEAPWPFLRFGVNEETVVLTRRNVLEVNATLMRWLDLTREEDQ